MTRKEPLSRGARKGLSWRISDRGYIEEMIWRASERAVISNSEALVIISGHQPMLCSTMVRRTDGIIIPHSGTAIMLVRMKCTGKDPK